MLEACGAVFSCSSIMNSEYSQTLTVARTFLWNVSTGSCLVLFKACVRCFS